MMMSSGDEHCLDIYLAKNKVGKLILGNDTDPLSLEYDPQWKKSGFALSPHLPLSGRIDPVAWVRFLNNLLPEGNGLESLLDNYRISKSNTFGLIRLLGTDTASGLSFYPSGHYPDKQYTFRPIPEAELLERLDQRSQQNLIVWDGKPRLSVAGVQDKINVVIDEHGHIGFGEGTLCSTHLLKFEQNRQTHLVLNEYIVMHLCKMIDLPVAEVALRRYGQHPALLVTRFDRKQIDKTQVLRRYVIDACQALNLPPEYKYERNFGSSRDVQHIREGANLPKLFALCQTAEYPALEMKRMLDYVLFNLCINNHDAHGKNFSYFLSKKGIQLTPAYDLVNIAVYPEFDQAMAMALGDEFDSQTVNAYQLADFADSCHVPRRLLVHRLMFISKKLRVSINNVSFSELIKTMEESRFVVKLMNNIRTRCQHLSKEAEAVVGMEL